MLLMGPIRSVSLCKTPVIRVNEDFCEHRGGGREGRTFITVGELGYGTWLSVNLAIKSSDTNEHGDGHVLRGKSYNF